MDTIRVKNQTESSLDVYLVGLDNKGELCFETGTGISSSTRYILDPRLYSWHGIVLPEKIKAKNIKQWIDSQLETLLGDLDAWVIVQKNQMRDCLWVCVITKELIEQVKKHNQKLHGTDGYSIYAMMGPQDHPKNALMLYQTSMGLYLSYQGANSFLTVFCPQESVLWDWVVQIKSSTALELRGVPYLVSCRENGQEDFSKKAKELMGLELEISNVSLEVHCVELMHGGTVEKRKEVFLTPKKQVLWLSVLTASLLIYTITSMLQWQQVRAVRQLQIKETQSLVETVAPKIGTIIDLRKQITQYVENEERGASVRGLSLLDALGGALEKEKLNLTGVKVANEQMLLEVGSSGEAQRLKEILAKRNIAVSTQEGAVVISLKGED